MVENRGVDGGELLERSHAPVAEHRSFSSPKWQVRILRAIVQPAASFLAICGSDFPQRCAVGSQPVRDDHPRATVLAHRFLEEFQCSFLVTRLGDKAL